MTATNLRPELAQRLRQRLDAFAEGFRHNLALLGPLGSGKTFQLQQLITPKSPALLIVYCPLFRESARSFLRRFLCAIVQAAEPLEDAAAAGQVLRVLGGASDAPAEFSLELLLQRAEPRLPKTAAAIRNIEPLLGRRLYGEAFSRALDTIPVLVQECGRPCVLMLDEFLFLEELGLVHAFHELGKRVMTWPKTLFIFSSSSVHRARTILRERLQLLFGQFELLTLDAVDAGQAAAWIRQELRGIRGAKTVSPFLTQWLGGYPWYLTVFLRRLRELATLGRRADVTEPLFLQTAWDLLGSAGGTLHQWCSSRVDDLSHGRVGARALEALIHIACGSRTMTDLSKRIGRGGLSETLQLLVERDLAQRNGTCWMVPDPILRCWVSTVLLAQRSDAHPSGADVCHRVEENLRGRWADWMRTTQLSFPDQVTALFGKFCDDTVSLDSKTGRLPKFQTIAAHAPDPETEAVYLVAEGQGKRWCASVQATPIGEGAIADFDAFCRAQNPKPSRKVVVGKLGLEENARLLAKAANMWASVTLAQCGIRSAECGVAFRCTPNSELPTPNSDGGFAANLGAVAQRVPLAAARQAPPVHLLRRAPFRR
jgi:hypothetical protein